MKFNNTSLISDKKIFINQDLIIRLEFLFFMII